jgi:hypothetical protein
MMFYISEGTKAEIEPTEGSTITGKSERFIFQVMLLHY